VREDEPRRSTRTDEAAAASRPEGPGDPAGATGDAGRKRFGAVPLARALAAAGACFFIAYFLALSLQRISYPFELEWMEGGSLQHLHRVLRGEPLYVTPSLDFVPFPYPPFYYYLGAVFAKAFGPNFFSLRLISLLSILGSMGLIYLFVWCETRRGLPALVAAGVFAATFRATGLYFDIARIDSLFLFLTLLALFLLRFRPSRPRLLAAALVSFLAVMTKQTGVVLLAPVCLWCMHRDWKAQERDLRRWRRFDLVLYYVLPTTLLVAAGSLLLNGVIDESFLRHIVNAQQSHGIRGYMIPWFFGRDLMAPLPVACLFAVAYLVLLANRSRLTDSFYLVVLVGTFLACIIPRIKVSGAANNIPPAHAVLAILFGISIVKLDELLGGAWPKGRKPAELFLALCMVVQLAVLAYSPQGLVPNAMDRLWGKRVVERIAGFEGEVLIPAQGYLAGMAGKKVYAHQHPVSDYAKSGLPDAPQLEREFAQAIRERRFAAIIDSTSGFVRGYPLGGVLQESYRSLGPVVEDRDAFKPISGFRVRPGLLWVPRESPADPGTPR
jgi:hypothetical protein